MKSNLGLLLMVVVVSLAMATRTKSKAHHKAKFDKKSNKERYRVESDSTSQQKKAGLTDLLAKVLSNKDDKDLQLPENEESLQQLQNILTKIPSQMKDEEDKKENKNSLDDDNSQMQQLVGMLKGKEEESSEDSVSTAGEEMRLKKIIQEGGEKDDKDSKQKQVFEKYWQITIPKDHLEEMKKNNTKAEGKFKENAQGTDEENPNASSFEGEVLMKINNKEVNDALEDQAMVPLYARLNGHSIYASQNKTVGYRGIIGAIEFEDIITAEDYTLIGKCCQNVYAISTGKMDGEDSYCFNIDTAKVNWELCGKDKGNMEMWRNSLNGFVIVWDLKRKGIYDAKELKKKQKNICEFPTGYNYFNQEQWPCNCAEGLLQSPINLVTEEAKLLSKARTEWYYNKGSNLLTKQFWKETVTLGTFGTFQFINEQFETKSWTANEVRFKFPAEHTIDGKQFDMEVQIGHTNSENDRAFVSLLIKKSNQDSEEMDKVLNQFMFELYEDRAQHQAGFIGCLDATPNMEEVLKIKPPQMSGLNMTYFTYQGSDTLPPCDETVTWFVYEHPLHVSGLLMDEIEKKILGAAGKKNSRQIMPTMERKVQHWVDPCPGETVAMPNDFQYVKVEGKRDFYGIYKKDEELGFEERVHFKNKDLKLEDLSDEKVKKMPKDIFDKLVKKFQLYISGEAEEPYDYYGPKSTWSKDYRSLVGNVAKSEAERDFKAKQDRKRRM